MDRRERTARALIQISRIFLVLGGLLLAVMSLYAARLTPSPDHIRRHGRRDFLVDAYNLMLDLGCLVRQEAAGKWMAAAALTLLLLGAALLAAGICLRRNRNG